MPGMSETEGGLPGHDWPLAGRDAEMDQIAAALGDRGTGSVVLAGAPGVGKTRLARESVSRARGTAAHADYVAATRAASSIPLGAVSHLLPDAPRTGPDLWRYAIGELAARAHGGRFVLGVDDAHLLDEPSAGLIHQLVLRGQVSVVAVVLAGSPAPDAVVALWKDGLARRLTVRPLSDAAMAELLGRVLGPRVEGRTRQHILRVTAGNPLLLRELLTGALEDGALVRGHGEWRWDKEPSYSASIRRLVEDRLAGLGEAARAALEVVACGEPVAATTLEYLTGRGMLDPDAVAEAERLGVVARQREVVVPAHPLDGEVIRALLPVGRARLIKEWLAGAAGLRTALAGAGPGLTLREQEIALLASSGLASKDIAAKLNLSVRTVSNHLGHVYAKLGITGRGELAALV